MQSKLDIYVARGSGDMPQENFEKYCCEITSENILSFVIYMSTTYLHFEGGWLATPSTPWISPWVTYVAIMKSLIECTDDIM